MSLKALVVSLLLLVSAPLALAACGGSDDAGADTGTAAAAAKTTFTIGSGADNPMEADILEFIATRVAPEHGVTVDVKELADSVALNEAVDNDELDGHVAQHWPYLSEVKDEQGWKVEPAAPLWVGKYTVYSSKHDSVDALPRGAKIAIPDDPSSQALALNVLADAGVIELDPSVEPVEATVRDVTGNPKDVEFTQIVISQIARTLQDVDAAVATASQFEKADIPADQRLHEAPADPSYAIQLVIKEGNRAQPGWDRLVAAFSDPAIADYVNENYASLASGVSPSS